MATSKTRSTSTKRSTAKRSTAKRATPKRATSRAASTPAAGEFLCPECGRSFARAAALGAHRSRAHGVAGQSAQATKRRSRNGTTATAGAKRSRRSPAAARNGVDRDALLKTLFPDGMPAREDVMRAASGWLDEAERLSQQR
jgi:predicted RNA-binding Zn-ribbon protein involved in translation (DUF1610 family)